MKSRMMSSWGALLAVVSLAACNGSPTPDASARSSEADSNAEAQGQVITTPEMRRALSAQLARSDSLLQLLRDTLVAALGPEKAAKVLEIHRQWLQLRTAECELLEGAFEGGTYAPVVELECLVEMAADWRQFQQRQFDFLPTVREFRERYDTIPDN